MEEEPASLAKAFCETVGRSRELLGGNGILLDYNVGRFVADAETKPRSSRLSAAGH